MCFQSWAARKNRSERLREHQRVLVTLDKMASSVVNTSARFDLDHLQCVQRVDDRPGPTGIPAARSARAKPTTLSRSGR